MAAGLSVSLTACSSVTRSSMTAEARAVVGSWTVTPRFVRCDVSLEAGEKRERNGVSDQRTGGRRQRRRRTRRLGSEPMEEALDHRQGRDEVDKSRDAVRVDQSPCIGILGEVLQALLEGAEQFLGLGSEIQVGAEPATEGTVSEGKVRADMQHGGRTARAPGPHP